MSDANRGDRHRLRSRVSVKVSVRVSVWKTQHRPSCLSSLGFVWDFSEVLSFPRNDSGILGRKLYRRLQDFFHFTHVSKQKDFDLHPWSIAKLSKIPHFFPWQVTTPIMTLPCNVFYSPCWWAVFTLERKWLHIGPLHSKYLPLHRSEIIIISETYREEMAHGNWQSNGQRDWS